MINRRGWIVVLVLMALALCVSKARAAQDARHRLDEWPLCEIARGILREAGGNVRLAEQLARRRGYGEYAIAMAKRFCRRD